MVPKHKIITEILEVGVVAIVRTQTADQAVKVVRACLDGGLSSVEITFTVDGAHRILEQLSADSSLASYKPILGAGTVLDSETARIAILSGASYIISPSFDAATATLCNRYAVPYMPGCYTPAEVVRAMEHGVDVIKLFPGSLLSPAAISAIRAPLPQANIMPTGGVSLENAAAWIRAGAVALGVGGDLVAGAKSGNYADISAKAKAYKEIVAQTRKELQSKK